MLARTAPPIETTEKTDIAKTNAILLLARLRCRSVRGLGVGPPLKVPGAPSIVRRRDRGINRDANEWPPQVAARPVLGLIILIVCPARPGSAIIASRFIFTPQVDLITAPSVCRIVANAAGPGR